MKLEILQENLSRGLAIVCRTLSTKPQMPILSHVLLVAKSGQLNLTVSNLETTITVTVGAKVETAGDFTVPAKTLLEIVSSLSAEKVSLDVTEGILSLVCGRFKAKVNGVPASEFPQVLEAGSSDQTGSSWTIDRATFLAAVGRVTFTAATDESRAILTGILFRPGPSGMVLAATDGFRLSVVTIDKITTEKTQEAFIVSAKTLGEVARILNDSKVESLRINLRPGTNEIFFDLGEIKMYSRLIAGNYPDFEKIIPPNSTIKVTISGEELLKLTRLAAIFARDSANIVKLKIQNSKIKISANAPQVGENEGEMDVQVDKGGSEEFAIAFNYRYLLDLLACIGGGELTVEFTSSLAAGVFRKPSDPNFLHIIMPVRVQN
jgi:DNA polymerase III subunit beta